MIVNLSVYGCRAQCDIGFRRGDHAYLDLPGAGLVRIRVAWSDHGYFGAVFLNAVDIASLTHRSGEEAKTSAAPMIRQRAAR